MKAILLATTIAILIGLVNFKSMPVSSRNTGAEIRDMIQQILGASSETAAVQIDLGTTGLATAHLTSAIERLKMTYPELNS